MIKKIICVFVTAALLFSLSSCGERETDGESIVGLWKYELNGKYRDAITEVIVDERVYVDIYYQFNEDGTGRSYASDGSFDRDFTYVYSNGVITITSDGYSFDQKCKLGKDTLTVHDDIENEDVVFIRQKTKG